MEGNPSVAAEMQRFTVVEQQVPHASEPEGARAGEDLQLRAPGLAGSSTTCRALVLESTSAPPLASRELQVECEARVCSVLFRVMVGRPLLDQDEFFGPQIQVVGVPLPPSRWSFLQPCQECQRGELSEMLHWDGWGVGGHVGHGQF